MNRLIVLFVVVVVNVVPSMADGFCPARSNQVVLVGRALEYYVHGSDPAWGAKDPLQTDTFAVMSPKDGPRRTAPLYVVLHSAGHSLQHCLDSLKMLHSHDIYRAPEDFYALYLDCRANQATDWWWGASGEGLEETPVEKRVMACVRWTIEHYGIDPDRVYLAGNSMGGSGTLGIGLRHGDVFAAIKANVPAGVEHCSARMGFGREDWARLDIPDPPVLVDYSAPDDKWSKGHETFFADLAKRRYAVLGFWGNFGHANNDLVIAEYNDIIHDFDWTNVVRRAAYPVFTETSSDDRIDFVFGAGPSKVPGQINGYFRWRNVSDAQDELSLELSLVAAETLDSRFFTPPELATARLAIRRIQRFHARPGDRLKWVLGTQQGVAKIEADDILDIGVVEIASEPRLLRVTREVGPETAILEQDASGETNRAALQGLLDRGGVVRLEQPGRYKLSGTVFIGSNTKLVCAPGVVFVKTDECGRFSHVICNKGAKTKTFDENIEIDGLEIAVNGMDQCDWRVAYGLRGQVAFFYAKNVTVRNCKILDLGRGQFGVHFCTFENAVVEDCDIRGWKDGVHLGRGRGFRVSRCTFDTGDDPIALNAHDYSTSNPELGWISEGLIEDCHDLKNPAKTVGFFCRILAGSWGEWKPGMSVQQSDTVTRPDGLYRVFMQPDGKNYVSNEKPESSPDRPNADGIVWHKVQDDLVTSCGVSNVVFRNLQLDQPRPLFSFHVDNDRYSRSCYPGTSVPAQTGVVFDGVRVGFDEVKAAFLLMTPVAGLTFRNCRWGNCTGAPAAAEDAWIDFNKNGVKDVYENRTQTVEARVADLLSQMTVEEKTCQLATLYGSGRVLKDVQPTAGWKDEIWKDGIGNIDEELNGVGKCYKTNVDLIYPFSNHVHAVRNIQRWFVEETRLGIPVDFSNEGIHGLNHTKATPLPAPIAIGSTWNRALVREAGEIAGEEARLLGYSNVYAPILDVVRDPRWGRTLECYGESPYLVGCLGAEMAGGVQSKGVASTLKHYAVYSVPKGGRDADCRTDPHVTPRELHEIFLAPFRHVIRTAHPLGVMCSYNDWNGEPVAASRYFLTDLLRGEYGFDGYVVSDSEAVEFVHTKHCVAETYEEACAQVLEAGLNVRTNFTPPEDFILPVRAAIASGRLPMAVIDRRVAEVLAVKFRLGLFDNPYLGDAENADRLAGVANHLDFVDRMQAEAMVLLKNADGFLPLDKSQVKKVLVAGPLADESNFMASRYGPNGIEPTSILKGLKECLEGSAEVVYKKGCAVVNKGWPQTEIVPTPITREEKSMMDDAVAAAADVDVIVAVLGEDEYRTGESRSRTSLDLPGRQQRLLERLVETGKPVVLVLVNGQPLTVNWADRHVAAILETWFPCARGGQAVAKALFGEINPSGKLTVTFPKSIGQIEYNFPFKKGSHGQQNRTGDPNGSGVTRVIGPLYPFGYGLSYTSFAYANEEVEVRGGGGNIRVTVSCDVTNTGTRDGAEVVQLYVRDLYASVVTYDSVLRGFEKVFLKAGETKRVTFTLQADDLKILDRNMKWTVEPGDFEVRVGSSSEDIRLTSLISVRGA